MQDLDLYLCPPPAGDIQGEDFLFARLRRTDIQGQDFTERSGFADFIEPSERDDFQFRCHTQNFSFRLNPVIINSF